LGLLEWAFIAPTGRGANQPKEKGAAAWTRR
jgi:hypothetical protein